jgi:hypothetical protein
MVSCGRRQVCGGAVRGIIIMGVIRASLRVRIF